MGEMITLTHEIVKDDIWLNEADFEFGGEKYIYHDQLEGSMDDDGSSHPFIYKRESDGKFFMIVVYRVRYGYEDYSYEDFVNECELFEVEAKEVKITRWVSV